MRWAKKMFHNSIILVTGGTGSLGQAMVKYLLSNFNPEKIIIFSRDEIKQWEMAALYKDESRIRFFIGDVRDKERLSRAFTGVDFVVHAAATKIVPTAEYNPFECLNTNVIGAMNVISAAIDAKVKKVVALSTDKASSPSNLYGASKLASDKLFIAGNSYSGKAGTKFSVVRYGNVMGSRGSVIPSFVDKVTKDLPLEITDVRMSRFMITLEQGIALIQKTFEEMIGGEIYVKKIPSMNIMKIAEAVDPNFTHRIIGIRPGEKLHEQMISVEDALTTYEYENHYKILPSLFDWHKDPQRIMNGTKVTEGFFYSSNTNNDWMTSLQLRDWIDKNLRDSLL